MAAASGFSSPLGWHERPASVSVFSCTLSGPQRSVPLTGSPIESGPLQSCNPAPRKSRKGAPPASTRTHAPVCAQGLGTQVMFTRARRQDRATRWCVPTSHAVGVHAHPGQAREPRFHIAGKRRRRHAESQLHRCDHLAHVLPARSAPRSRAGSARSSTSSWGRRSSPPSPARSRASGHAGSCAAPRLRWPSPPGPFAAGWQVLEAPQAASFRVRVQAPDGSLSIHVPADWAFLAGGGKVLTDAPDGAMGFIFTAFSGNPMLPQATIGQGVIGTRHLPPGQTLACVFNGFRDQQFRVHSARRIRPPCAR